MKAIDFKNHLTNDLIPFWNRQKDDEYGGFYGYVNGEGQADKEADKGVILNSRILWFYSSAYMLLRDAQLLSMSEHAYRFLKDFCIDKQEGGVYWSLHRDGTPADDTKHTYNQAFAVYALSAYYRASGCREALDNACGLFRLIEERCSDSGGYLEAFHKDFTPSENDKLSENGVLATRTMNTLLHVLEAYTELYLADPADAVKAALQKILLRFKEKIYNAERKACEVFFDEDYHSLIDLESFGHDIEASWLLDRACRALGDDNCHAQMRPVIEGLAESAYRNGMDLSLGALNNEREKGITDTQKIWWVQAEAVTGFYNAGRLQPDKPEYLQAAQDVWNFIREYVIDRASGEWYESLTDPAEPDRSQALVHPWKCPYHNGRMCIEMIRRLSGES